MSYTKTQWVNDGPPALNATNLNHIEQGIYDAHQLVTNRITIVDTMEDMIDTDMYYMLSFDNKIYYFDGEEWKGIKNTLVTINRWEDNE